MSKYSADILDHVFKTIEDRHAEFKIGENSDSRTVRLFKRGTHKIAQKFGEEAVETVIEAIAKRRGHLIEESADVLYFLLVMWKDRGIEPKDVWKELSRRHKMPEQEERNSRLK
ncbi:MAG: phosphoribosyl-ATP diphosphatase [Alphaproteobacteria bacterium]|jgi:phosphoribosyl-ATP pyrophosphohydrolase